MSHHFENRPIVFPDPENVPLAVIRTPLDALYCLKWKVLKWFQCRYCNPLWYMAYHFETQGVNESESDSNDMNSVTSNIIYSILYFFSCPHARYTLHVYFNKKTPCLKNGFFKTKFYFKN